jgi:hypothetical protein
VKGIPIYVKNVPNDMFNSHVFKYENRQKSKKEPYEHQQRQSPEVGEGKNLKIGWNVGKKVPDGTYLKTNTCFPVGKDVLKVTFFEDKNE